MDVVQISVSFIVQENVLEQLEFVGFSKSDHPFAENVYTKQVGKYLLVAYMQFNDTLTVTVHVGDDFGEVRKIAEMEESSVEEMWNAISIMSIVPMVDSIPAQILITTLTDIRDRLRANGWIDQFGMNIYQIDSLTFSNPNQSKHYWLDDDDPKVRYKDYMEKLREFNLI